MIFDHPAALGFLFLFAVFIPVAIVRYRKGRERAALFAAAAPSEERKSMLRELRLRMIISDAFFIFFTGFLIVALAGPRWGLRIVADYHRGVDIMLAFDLSRSMNVPDCPSFSEYRFTGNNGISRLERGVEIARELVDSLGDLRIGTAVGKGKGVLAVPLTYDFETIQAFLYGLDSRALTGRGTNLESLLDAAVASFQDFIPSRRGIILFSDGETLEGSFQEAVEKARKTGITLCTVGLGSDQGGPVPVEKSPDAPGGFLLAADGEEVTSARQVSFLRTGAEKTGGIYVDGSQNDAVRILAEYVNSLSAESQFSGHRREANPRWRIFVLAAMTCLGGARILGFTLRKRAPGPGKKRAVVLSLCLFLFCSCARTQGKLLVMEGNFFNTRGLYTEAISSYMRALDHDETAPYAEYGLGAAYFGLEEGAAALERYEEAERRLSEFTRGEHTELRYRIYYNTGIIYFEMGEYDNAARAFREALKVDSSKIEAKRNLELSLLTIARVNSPQALSPQGEGSREGAEGIISVLFEYLRQKEQEQWKSREWIGESDFSGPDY